MITISDEKGHPYLEISGDERENAVYIAEQYHYEILGEMVVRRVPVKYFQRFSV